MPNLIEPLEYLAKEGIRINFSKDVSAIFVSKDFSGGYIDVVPEEEKGTIGVCFVLEKSRGKSNLLHINSSGYGLTQIAFKRDDRLYTIYHTRKDFLGELEEKNTVKVSASDYIRRLEDELDFLF